MQTVSTFNFHGKKALIRVDFNVPLNERFEITDDTRIKATIPTINKILADGGSVILMSHLGRPQDGPTDKYSLKHLVNPLSVIFNRPVKFADDCIGQSAIDLSAGLQAGEILLLENLRFYKEEEKGDVDFAKKLSLLLVLLTVHMPPQPLLDSFLKIESVDLSCKLSWKMHKKCWKMPKDLLQL
jgi:phosphoglycerate kinase